jgi:Tfp pilus assembly PilM family ATPase
MNIFSSINKGANVGIDIGSYSVKLVQLVSKPKGISINKVGYKELLDGKETSSTEIKEELVIKALSEHFKEQNIGRKKVSVAV